MSKKLQSTKQSSTDRKFDILIDLLMKQHQPAPAPAPTQAPLTGSDKMIADAINDIEMQEKLTGFTDYRGRQMLSSFKMALQTAPDEKTKNEVMKIATAAFIRKALRR